MTEYETLNHLPIGALCLDESQKITFANKKFSEVFSCSGEALEGQSFEALFSPRDRRNIVKFHQQLTKCSDGYLDFQIKVRIDRKDIPTRMRMQQMQSGWQVLVESMETEQKQVYDLSLAQKRFETIVTYMAEGILILNEKHEIAECNNLAFELLNLRSVHGVKLTSEALVGKVLEDFLTGEKFQELFDALKAGSKNPTTSFSDFFAIAPHYLQVKMNPIFIPQGGFIGSCITISDLTAIHKAETALREARDIAEEATKAKANFLATMSHEIRTPMNGVVGMIDLLRESKLDEEQQHLVETVKSSAYSLLTIINDILDFSKIEAGKLELEEIPISILDAVEGVGEVLAVTSRKKGVKLCTYVDPEIPDAVIGDKVRLRQIIFNLGGNAIKFTEQGKVLLRADKIESDHKDAVKIRFQVIDEGIGIPEKAQKSLFQAFSQVDASTTRRFGGTGLGLSICQRLTELMAGDIGVESVEGEGSTFHVTVTFPISHKNTFEHEGHDLDGLRILMAIDDPELGPLLPTYLSSCRAEVSVVEHWEDIQGAATRAAKSGAPFDVIFLGSGRSVIENIAWIEDVSKQRTITSKYIVACSQRSRKEREPLDGIIYLDADPIKRDALIRCVAVAAGRASPDIELDDAAHENVAIVAPTVEAARASGQLILLAEDNKTNQDVITRQLNKLGYALEIANDGLEAQMLLKENSYAILLTDCHMPNMDGFELVKEIRASEDSTDQRMPIVAITASVMKEEIDNCYASGMDDYLPKPLEMDKLKAKLRKWMPKQQENTVVPSVPHEAKAAVDVVDVEASNQLKPMSQPIDPAVLKDMFGDDDEMFQEILCDFIEPGSNAVAEILDAFQKQSPEGVSAGAHKLQSSARAIGAQRLADICRALEEAGKHDDWNTINGEIEGIKEALTNVIAYIEDLESA